MAARFLPKARFDELLAHLRADGFEVIGPTVAAQAIIYAPIQSHRDLPIGWGDWQAPGQYRLERRNDDTWFGFAVGPYSWKQFLYPPRIRLWEAAKTAEGFRVTPTAPERKRRAFLGVRGCELHAIAVQDRTFFRDGQIWDPYYAAARANLFVMAVECTRPAATCFCTSMHTGPDVDPRRLPLPRVVPSEGPDELVDWILTELADGFVVRAESQAGAALADALQLGPATEGQVDEAQAAVRAAAQRIQRQLDTDRLYERLQACPEHSRWDEVATRCLGCTNCTMVCPTCFCMSVEEVTDLSLETTARERVWDSCFNPDFAAVHGGNHRASLRGRYRQWLTHKFSTWIDQFEVTGCVGCGRCITWCPVGIDVTEELAALRRDSGEAAPPPAPVQAGGDLVGQ